MAMNVHASPAMNVELGLCPSYAPQPDGTVSCVVLNPTCRACGTLLTNEGIARCPRTLSAVVEDLKQRDVQRFREMNELMAKGRKK